MLPESPAPSRHIALTRRPWRGALATVLALGLAASGCADDDPSSSRQDDDQASTTTSGPPGGGTGAEEEGIERVALRRYLTRTDVTPPAIRVVSSASPTPGYVFLAPKRAGAQAGPLIVDDNGDVVWSARQTGTAVAAPVAEVAKDGFETMTRIEAAAVVAVGALDSRGEVLDRSETITVDR